jgi:hypothetical protein
MRSSVGPRITRQAAILTVENDDDVTVRVTFSAPVTVTNGPTINGAFTVDSDPPSSVNQTSPTDVFLAVTSSLPGLAWQLTAQPTWCSTPLAFPRSGVVV